MKTKFGGGWGLQKGNEVEAIVGGKKYVGIVSKVVEDKSFVERKFEITTDDGTKVEADIDSVRRTKARNRDRKSEYAQKRGLI